MIVEEADAATDVQQANIGYSIEFCSQMLDHPRLGLDEELVLQAREIDRSLDHLAVVASVLIEALHGSDSAHHRFQGGATDAQSRSSACLSRIVSTHCQKPTCW